jgi:hypothetical protein
MIETQKKCPKCDGNLIKGFILDYAHSVIIVPNWHEGSPKKSFWWKTSQPSSDGIPIAAFRCSRCGFIEFYSNEKFKAE